MTRFVENKSGNDENSSADRVGDALEFHTATPWPVNNGGGTVISSKGAKGIDEQKGVVRDQVTSRVDYNLSKQKSMLAGY